MRRAPFGALLREATFWAASSQRADEVHAGDGAVIGEEFLDVVLGGLEGNVGDVNGLGHVTVPCRLCGCAFRRTGTTPVRLSAFT